MLCAARLVVRRWWIAHRCTGGCSRAGRSESAFPDLSERDREIVLGRFEAAGWICEGCSCSAPDAIDSLDR